MARYQEFTYACPERVSRRFIEMRPTLMRFALRRVNGDYDMAEDILQVAAIDVLRRGERFDAAKSSLDTWIINQFKYTVVHETSETRKPVKRRGKPISLEKIIDELDGCDPFPDATDIEAELCDADLVERILGKLPVRWSEVLRATMDGETSTEVAKTMNVSRGRVKQIITDSQDCIAAYLAA